MQDAQAVLRRTSPRSPRRRRPPGRTRRRSCRGPCPGGRASSRALRCRASSASRAAGPARSSVVRCSVTSGGNSSVRAVSVAIWRFLSLRVSVRRPGSPGGAPFRAAGSPLVLGVDGRRPAYWMAGLRLTPTMVESVTVAAAALAVARSVAMARVRRADRRRRGPGRRGCRSRARAPTRSARCSGRGLLQPARRRAAGAAVRHAAAPPPARPAVHDRPRLRGHGAAGARSSVGILVGGLIHRSAVIAERADQRAVFAAVHDYVVQTAPAFVAGLGTLDDLKLETDRYRACVDGPGEAPALPVRQHRPVARGRRPATRPASRTPSGVVRARAATGSRGTRGSSPGTRRRRRRRGCGGRR